MDTSSWLVDGRIKGGLVVIITYKPADDLCYFEVYDSNEPFDLNRNPGIEKSAQVLHQNGSSMVATRRMGSKVDRFVVKNNDGLQQIKACEPMSA